MVAHLPALLLYALLTLALTWPLATNLSGLVPHDLGDPLLSTWTLWWNARVLPFTATWWDGLSFFPAGNTLTLSDHRVGLGLVTTPFIWLGASPVTSYNIAFLLSFFLSAAAGYALCFTLVHSRAAALIGGLVFGFNPFRAEHLSHLELLASYWLPIVLLALHRWASTQQRTWLFVLAVALTMQALTCGYYFFFSGALLALWLLWFVPRDLPIRQYASLAVALAAPLVVLAPILLKYREAHVAMGLSRTITEIEAFSADVIGLITAPASLAIWHSPAAWQRLEGAIMPGMTAVVLVCAALFRREAAPEPPPAWRRSRALLLVGTAIAAAAGSVPALIGPVAYDVAGLSVSISRAYKPLSIAVWLLVLWILTSPVIRAAWRRRSAFEFYVLATGAMWLFAFGPTARLLGHRVMYKAPYAWLMVLPGFGDEFRAPARFAMLAALTLAVAAAVAFWRFASGRPLRVRVAAACLVAAGVTLDGWIYPFVTVAAPTPLTLPETLDDSVAVLELPIGPYQDAAAMYHSVIHGHRTVNGMSGYEPPHYGILRVALQEGSVEALAPLAAYGDIAIFVAPEARHVSPLLETQTLAQPVAQTDTHEVLLLRRSTPVSTTADHRVLVPLRWIASQSHPQHVHLMNDGDHRTAWWTGMAQTGDEQLTVELAHRSQIDEIHLWLGGSFTAYPRVLSLEVSEDATAWRQVWVGPTAALSVAAAIEDPRNVAVAFGFPPQRARYVRIKQLGTSNQPWAVAEVRIFGGRQLTSASSSDRQDHGSIGSAEAFQMSDAYSRIVRSLENFPMPATFRMDERVQRSASR